MKSRKFREEKDKSTQKNPRNRHGYTARTSMMDLDSTVTTGSDSESIPMSTSDNNQ